MSKITCRNLWKIFGPQAHKLKRKDKLDEAALKESGHVIAVKDVSFEVEAGDTFVVMGSSGSGKSTLVRCLTRLIEPTWGEIMVNGVDVMHMNPKQLRDLRLRRMSMVFQRFGLFPHRRVIDNVGYGLEVRGDKKKDRLNRAHEMLALVGLEGWEYNYPHELSGGMQQRVGLARALAVDPEILLFDEPFSALDPLIRREMQDEVLRLQRIMKKTVIFITHDFGEAIKLGNYIAMLKDGSIIQIGKPEEIITAPATAYVQAFARDIPRTKVLTARHIMKAIIPSATNGATCSPDMTIEMLLPLVLSHDHPLVVMDDQQHPLGMVDRAAIMEVLEAAQ